MRKTPTPSPALSTGRAELEEQQNRTISTAKPKPTSTPDVFGIGSLYIIHFWLILICYLFLVFKSLTVQLSLGICGGISSRTPGGYQSP